MDLIIKNLEKLQDYHTKEGKHSIERLVLDFDKLSEMEGFTKIFEKSCEKYVEVGESYLVPNEDIKKAMEPAEPIHKEAYIKMCANCKYCEIDASQEPCRSCWRSMENRPNNWKPSEPTLKEATEHMQSEFDATGIDTKIFMNRRVIKR